MTHDAFPLSLLTHARHSDPEKANMRIALIDDSRSALAAFQHCLKVLDEASCEPFLDPLTALRAAERQQFDLVICDYTMPGLDGIEVIRRLRRQQAHSLVPIIMVTSRDDRNVRLEAFEAGATEFIHKPFETVELVARVRNLLTLRRAQIDLGERAKLLGAAVTLATQALRNREEEIIWRLARAIEYRDGNTGEHVSRVATISRMIAEELGLDEERCRDIYLAAPLHDIGKIAIPDVILGKPGALSAGEYREMQRHVEIGADILSNGTSDLLIVAERIAGGHHEKWDGTGYPNALAGADIPIEARIVAVADVFEALCTERSYKKAWPIERAYQEIVAGSGKHFDPDCISAFERRWPDIASLMDVTPRPHAVQLYSVSSRR